MMGVQGAGGFSARDVLKEMHDVIKESAKSPAAKDRELAIDQRVEEITKALDAAGIEASGLTLIAIVKMGEQARNMAEAAIMAEKIIAGLFERAKEG